jgi:hypothetical protein
MMSEQMKARYAEMAGRMLETTPEEVPAGILRRISHIHELYRRNTAHMDLDIQTLLMAMVVEESGLIPWAE